jgi:SAM-dependent methyltransferase
MPQQSIVTGRVNDLDRYERATGKSMQADAYFQRIGEIARDFFTRRNLIPQTENHDRVIDTVDRLIVEHMSGYARAGLKFLDVGGSTGKRILDIEQKLRLEKYVIDIDDISVRVANGKGIQARQSNVAEERFPFEDGTFDAVSSFWTFEVMQPENHTHVISEIHRVLKPGGIFYFQDDKHGVSPQEEHYRNVLEPRGYKPGTFFYGVFEVPDLSEVRGNTGSVHLASDLDPKARLIGEPMYGKGFSLDELDQLVSNCFDMEKISLIELSDVKTAGKEIASSREQVEQLKHKWAPFLTVLRKR